MIPVFIFNIESVRTWDRVASKVTPVKPRRLAALAAVIIFASLSLEAQTPQRWFEKGLDAFRRQEIEIAQEHFKKAADADPANPDYPFYLALCHHQAGRLEEADAAYTRSLDLGGDPDLVLMRRGNLRWSKGDVPGALRDFGAVIAGGGPSAASARRNRGNLELSEGMYEAAAEDYAAYLLAEPEALDRETIERVAQLLGVELEGRRRRTHIADMPEPPGRAARHRRALVADMPEPPAGVAGTGRHHRILVSDSPEPPGAVSGGGRPRRAFVSDMPEFRGGSAGGDGAGGIRRSEADELGPLASDDPEGGGGSD